MLGLAIRYGHLEDADAIAELVTRDPSDRTTSKSDVAEMFSRGSFLVLDRDQGGLAASVFLSIREGRGEVGLLSVACDLDAPDLPQRLIEVAEMVCVAEGCEALELCLDRREGLPELSREMGFRPLGPSLDEGGVGAEGDGLRLEKRLL